LSKFITKVETRTETDSDGNEKTTKLEKSTELSRNNEPDYIKIYTRMWAEFNGVPNAYRDLFLQLAMRMTYCNSSDLDNAQIVYTGKPFSENIMSTLNWKIDMYNKGLKELVKSGAIKRVARGVYQINPQYAGKGEWKYNPRLERGGIEDLIATFSFKDKKVSTKIIWSDNGDDSEFNKMYRKGIGVDKSNETVLTQTTVSAI